MLPHNLEVEADSDCSTLSETSSAAAVSSPHYMKTTTSSSAKKEVLQKSARTLTRRCSFKPARSMARLGSKQIWMRKSSGGPELKKKLNKSRSITRTSRSCVILSHDPNASHCPSEVKNGRVQVSPRNLNANVESRKSLSNSKPIFADSGNKSMRIITRTSSLRAVRILTKMASLKTKRSSAMKKWPPVPDSRIQKATCSSALKDSTTPDHLELQPGGSESEGISIMKVCPYSYCSLHGHSHSDLPPLKRFVSMRRRLLKTQRSKKLERVSSRRPRRSSNSKKVIQKNLVAGDGDPGVGEAAHDRKAVSSTRKMATPKAVLRGDAIFSGKDKDTSNEVVNAESEIMVGKKSESCICSKDDIHELCEFCTAETSVKMEFPTRKETTAECCRIRAVEENNQIISSDSEPDHDTDIADKSQMEKQKHVGLWNLIYQHMVSETAAEDETLLPPNEVREPEREDDGILLRGVNRSTSCQDLSETGVQDQVEGSHNIQLHQHDVIKLIQEAFDRILSNIPDHSSDDQSTNGETASEKELLHKSHGEEKKLSISASSDSGSNITMQDEGEMRLKTDNSDVSQRKLEESKAENKFNHKSSKNWSNLKRVIILKRFVKALEKVRELNLRKPRYLPVEPESEAEKVHLRHQTTQQKKHSEEWMLDHALQQVIATLAPAQKRKVAMLVQAFEKVTPASDVGSSPESTVSSPSCPTPEHDTAASSGRNGSGEEKKPIFGIILCKTSGVEGFKVNRKQFSDFCTKEGHIPEASTAPQATTLGCSCIQEGRAPSLSKTTAKELEKEFESLNQGGDKKLILKGHQTNSVTCKLVGIPDPKLFDKPSPEPVDDLQKSNEQFLMNGKGGKEESSVSVSDDCDNAFNEENLESNNHANKSSELPGHSESQSPKCFVESVGNMDLVSSRPSFDKLEESTEVTEEETRIENKSTLYESESTCSPSEAEEKQKHTRLWYLIYKHMVSGTEAALKEEEEGKGGDDNTLIGEDKPESAYQDIKKGNHRAGDQKIDLQQIEAIRLVEEAIDEIQLPEIQDELPEDQPVTGSITSDQAHLEKKPGDGKESFISIPSAYTNRTTVEQTSMLDQKEPCLNTDSLSCQEQPKAVAEEREGSKPPTQKSWSHLKKVIMLRRFIKAMEKVKKFNPQKPRFLPLNPEEEAEKVHLRHQDMEDRKNSDEWMLDYALQQVVVKLTPARKRKVALLVEAFETVAPT